MRLWTDVYKKLATLLDDSEHVYKVKPMNMTFERKNKKKKRKCPALPNFQMFWGGLLISLHKIPKCYCASHERSWLPYTEEQSEQCRESLLQKCTSEEIT